MSEATAADFKPVTRDEVTSLVAEMQDLHKQATQERSHYYVGSRTKLAADIVSRLWVEVQILRSHTAR